MMNLTLKNGLEINIFDEKLIINGIEIDENIFDSEMVDYKFVFVDQEIDDLLELIAEDNDVDNELIKRELKYLFSIRGRYALSSIDTDDYIDIENKDYIDIENEKFVCGLTIEQWFQELLDLHLELHPEDHIALKVASF